MKGRIETFRNMSTTNNQYWGLITDPDWRKLSNRIQTNTSLPQDQKERQEEDDKDNGPNPPIQSTEENEWIAHQQTQSMKTQYHLPDTEEGEEPNKPTTEEEDDNTTNHYPDTEEEEEPLEEQSEDGNEEDQLRKQQSEYEEDEGQLEYEEDKEQLEYEEDKEQLEHGEDKEPTRNTNRNITTQTNNHYNLRRRIQVATGEIPNIPTNLYRDNKPPPPKQRKKYQAAHVKPIDVPPIAIREFDIDTDHPQAQAVRNLKGSVFRDPNTDRLYEVILIYYDHKYKRPVAYRRPLDDIPPDPFDARPWEIEGETGIRKLINQYKSEQPHLNNMEPTTPWPSTEGKMLTLQRQDPNWQPIIDQLLQTGDENQDTFQYNANRYVYLAYQEGGKPAALRMHKIKDNETLKTKSEEDRIVLPQILTSQLLKYYHDEQAHPGIQTTIETIAIRYWWPSNKADITTYVQSCQFCQKHKVYHQQTPIPIQTYGAPSYPFEVVHIDLTGPLPRTLLGNSYILVIKCSLTRAAEIITLISKEPIQIARALLDRLYNRYGNPRLVHSDRGREFLNPVIRHISALYQTKHVPTTPGNPRSNGLVEQHNSILKDQLSVFANARQDDWDTFLTVVSFAYMTTVCLQTGYTPFFLLYGHEARQTCDNWINAFKKVPTLPKYVKKT